MKTIILATQNAGKAREFKELTGGVCEVLTMAEAGVCLDIDETGTTFAENARIKARTVWQARAAAGFHDTVISDDSGIEIDFLDKKPGIYSSRWLGEDTPYTEKNQIVLDLLAAAPEEKRTARYVCAMSAVLPDGSELSVLETVEGRIAYEAKGENGFGYDPIFLIPQTGLTFAEMSAEAKHAISHRGKALRSLLQLLNAAGIV
ncbi:MAG: RdgB/HAM1 family non-canonical purine NTP pyrophosphatase [Lachnospiraceae bacterium]|jgi:XTP/dITP diphosphohydrolase|nr:RdgB/HAM1 family non-canonical purine NTP pyrophosphatase [Lachnospiraceae bacterium]